MEKTEQLYNQCFETILRRDRARKDAELAQAAYIREFGDLMVETFRARAECTRKERIISFCTQMEHMDRRIDGRQMELIIAEHMKESDKDLQDITAENEEIKRTKPLSPEDSRRVEEIYRRLAEKLHPDIHPEFDKDGAESGQTADSEQPAASAEPGQADASAEPGHRELWDRIIYAYEHDKLEDLAALEQEAERFLAECSTPPREISAQGLIMRIRQIGEQTRKITSAEPYMFKVLLENPASVAGQKADLQAIIERCRYYSKKLDDTIAGFKIE